MKDITLEVLLQNKNLLLDRPIDIDSDQIIRQNDNLLQVNKTNFDPFQMKGIRALLE